MNQGTDLAPVAVVVFSTLVAVIAAVAALLRSGRVPGIGVRPTSRTPPPRGAAS